jgi:DNA-binding PucR family transcriptional regulator
LLSRAAALGWANRSRVAVLAGRPPQAEPEAVVEGVRRAARHLGIDTLAGVQADRLVVVVADAADPRLAAERLSSVFATGQPVCVGPVVDGLHEAGLSAAAALAALSVAAAWPGARGAVSADDLLPERALDGDPLAHDQLVHDVFLPLRDAAGALLETVSAYIDNAGSLEATARALFVHPNTVRYRLRKATDACGWAATEPRHALVLHAALSLGRLAEARGEI